MIAVDEAVLEAIDLGTIGGRVKYARLAAGLSQRELEAIAGPGVSYAYISRIEANTRNPSVKALRKIAPALGRSVKWLEEGVDELGLNRDAIRALLEGQATALRSARGELDRLSDVFAVHEQTLETALTLLDRGVFDEAPSEGTSSVPQDDEQEDDEGERDVE